MALHDQQEVIETLDEIGSLVSSLTSDLTDKKTISDVMLALEKIGPDFEAGGPPGAGRLCQALALLYEKYLMEIVDDGAPGLDSTSKGVCVLKNSLTGEQAPDLIEKEADLLTAQIVEAYGICVPGAPTSVALASGRDSADKRPAGVGAEDSEDEEDNFFAGAEPDTRPDSAPEQADEDEAPPANPFVARLSKLASDVTMLDSDMTDKKLVSDIMMEFEKLGADLKSDGQDPSLVALAEVLGLLYEKSLMEGIQDGQTAIDLTADGVMALSIYFDSAQAGDPPEQALEVVERARSLYGLEVSLPGDVSDARDDQPGQADEPPLPSGAVEQAGFDIITVAGGEDLVIYQEFVSEVGDSVNGIETDLLELENDPTDEELINNLFRAFHSMKGAAGFLGVSTINVLCHEAETLLDKFRKKILVCDQDMMDALLKTVDVVKAVNEGLGAACQKATGELPDARMETPKFDTGGLVRLLTALSNQEVADEELFSIQDEGGKDTEPLGAMLVKDKKISPEQLSSALKAQENKQIGKILVNMGAVDKKTLDTALEAQAVKRKKVQASTLKIDTEKLDSLLELVGELVISQSIVSQDTVLTSEGNSTLVKSIANLGKITKNIQDHVMALRMVPLKQTFQKMNRLVRDLSKKMRKPVNFQVSGEDTEIDKTLIEELNDPLVHLLRNSMDHGLEDAEARKVAGKSKIGSVRLNAFHRGGNVYIEVIDDGKGVNRERVLQKAVEKGLVEPDTQLSDQDINNLILLPGFSTHDVATDISGRGVGMDVVRSNIDRLGGRLDITSKPGKGSTFTLRLPLTMAIVDGMLVKIGVDRFIIPTISIRESIRPKEDEISTLRNKGEMIDIRGRLLPLVRLHRFLGIRAAEQMNPWDGLVIIVENEDREYGFLVDDLLGQQQVVIKSLDRRFKGLPGISGGTILGDGRVGLILDVGGVVAKN